MPFYFSNLTRASADLAQLDDALALHTERIIEGRKEVVRQIGSDDSVNALHAEAIREVARAMAFFGLDFRL